MALTAFATPQDYAQRFGEPDDPGRLQTLLGDASAFIASQPGFRLLTEGDPGRELQDANLRRVTCAIVRRSLTAGDFAGLSNMSQGAGGYSASVTFSNPGEDFFLTKAERKTLGLGGGRIGQTWPYDVERGGE